jgi:hypothetical protein
MLMEEVKAQRAGLGCVTDWVCRCLIQICRSLSLRSIRLRRNLRCVPYGCTKSLPPLNTALPKSSLRFIQLRRNCCFASYSFVQHGCAEVFASLNMASSEFSLRSIRLRRSLRLAWYSFAEILASLNTTSFGEGDTPLQTASLQFFASLDMASPKFSLRSKELCQNSR